MNRLEIAAQIVAAMWTRPIDENSASEAEMARSALNQADALLKLHQSSHAPTPLRDWDDFDQATKSAIAENLWRLYD